MVRHLVLHPQQGILEEDVDHRCVVGAVRGLVFPLGDVGGRGEVPATVDRNARQIWVDSAILS
jgi:hypothetical protein